MGGVKSEVVCDACPRQCRLAEGAIGFCRSNAVGTDIANGWLPFLMKGENDERRESDA